MRRLGWLFVLCLGAVGCHASSDPGGSSGSSTSSGAGTTTGGSGGGSSGGSGGAVQFDAFGQALHDGLATFSQGGTFRVAGVGTFSTIADGGALTTTLTTVDGAKLTLTQPDEDHLQVLGDLDGDGTPDFQDDASRSAGVETTVSLSSSRFDGTFDRRETQVLEEDGGLLTETLEVLDGGGFVVVGGNTLAEEDDTPEDRQGLQGFPYGASLTPTLWEHVRIASGSTPGACSDVQIQRLQQYLAHDLVDWITCMGTTNSKAYFKVTRQLSRKDLVIGCGNTHTAAATLNANGWLAAIGPILMNLNFAEYGTDNDADTLAAYLNHEMMHYSGYGHPDRTIEEQGQDLPYRCGRYCSRCNTSASVGAGDAAADCAACSDSPGRKAACGIRNRWVDIDCPPVSDVDVGGCQPNGGGADVPGSDCHYDETEYCDGSLKLPQLGFSNGINWCATGCPAGSTMANAVALCTANQAPGTGTACTEPPSICAQQPRH